MSANRLSPRPARAAHASAQFFLTKEQAKLGATGSLQEYWRLDDALCAKLLSIGTAPAHFPALRAFFPFIRCASVLKLPMTRDFLPSWLNMAFYSGVIFGTDLPTATEDILEHDHFESTEALRRLRVLKDCLGRCSPTSGNLFRVFRQICQTQWKSVRADRLLDELARTWFNSFKAGLAAVSLAKTDPLLFEFVDVIEPPLDAPRMPLSYRLLMLTPLLAHGRSAVESITHPLLQVAATHYKGQPQESAVILPFFSEQLWAGRRLSENRRPATEQHMLKWISAGLDYGRRMKAEHPERIAKVFTEVGEIELGRVKQLVQKTVDQAGGTEPTALAAALLNWHGVGHAWHKPAFYGLNLERIVLCSDFAIWIPWIL